jgi:hypothetical protein
MIGSILLVLALIIMVIIWIKYNIRLAFATYIIFSFITPHLHIFNLILSFEIIAFPLISILYFLTPIFKKVSIFSFIFKIPHNFVFLVLFIQLVSTVISIVLGFGEFQGSVKLFGVIRVFLLILFAYSLLEKKHFNFILIAVLTVNTCVVIYQVLFPSSVHLFYNLFFKESLTPLATYKEIGSFVRCTGTFGSPINLGALSLISFSWFLGFFLNNKGSILVFLYLLMSIICGLFAVSKLSLFGIPLMIFFSFPFFIKKILFKKFNILKISIIFILMIIISTPLLYIVINYALHKYSNLSRYLFMLNNPLQIFASRYSFENQAPLIETFEVFKKFFFLGIGFTVHENEFVGDSLYISILHSGGLLGFFTLAFLFVYLLAKLYKLKDYSGFFVLISFLLSGFAFPVYFTVFNVLILSYCLKSSGSFNRSCFE